MKYIFIDCSLGISGDMLASALFHVGVPKSIFLNNLVNLKIDKNFNIDFIADYSQGIKGILCNKNYIKNVRSKRSLNEIKKILFDSSLNDFVISKVIKVFEILAEAESIVHGLKINDVHFHELGSIDSIIDIVNVCSAIDFLKPEKIFASNPPAGKGSISSSHGVLPVPVPTVLEIARQQKITLNILDDKYMGEITTPTGIALIAALVDKHEMPKYINIDKIGIGLGTKNILRPNFLRVILIDKSKDYLVNKNKPIYQSMISQEAWIDDSSPEDIAILIERLRSAGAVDVVYYPVDMKKGRKGICIKVLVRPGDKTLLREVWFNYSTTLGLRENEINRWILPRRILKHKTSFGEITFKQAMRPNGHISIKIEHDDLFQISLRTGLSIEKIRQELFIELSEFYIVEDWSD